MVERVSEMFLCPEQPQRCPAAKILYREEEGDGGGSSNISNACRVRCKPESEMKICSSIASNARSACHYVLQWINRKNNYFSNNSGNLTMLGGKKTFISYSWIFMKELFLKGTVKKTASSLCRRRNRRRGWQLNWNWPSSSRRPSLRWLEGTRPRLRPRMKPSASPHTFKR